MKNCFPSHIIHREVNNYLQRVCNPTKSSREGNTKETPTRFFKLPFIGPYSLLLQRKIRTLTKRYCKGIDIRIVFTTYKLKNMFGVKDSVPNALLCALRWCINSHVQAVTPVMSGKPLDNLPHGFTNIYTLTVILTSSFVDGEEIKLEIFADDLTGFLRNEQSFYRFL